ncbi:hypothetical protein CUMW_124270 [Citrus unshiu]|nr:hypothetical protein CUMW_124270 [Citrus unshiu]
MMHMPMARNGAPEPLHPSGRKFFFWVFSNKSLDLIGKIQPDCIFKIEKLENVLKQQVSFLPDGDWSSYVAGPPFELI